MITRRKLVAAFGAGAFAPPMALAPFSSFAQQPPKVWRIGFMGTGSAVQMTSRVEALRRGLSDLGYVEGKNIVIEYRYADGKSERYPILAAELVRLNVDVLATHAQGTAAAQRATRTIPIVTAATNDLVALGLVPSLARPGGNLTGGIFFADELAAKRIELLKETIPGLTRVALLLAANNVANPILLDVIAPTVKHLKLTMQQILVQEDANFESAFADMAKQRAGAAAIPDTPLFMWNAKTVAALALKHRLPLCGTPELAEAGGMLGYGVHIPAMFYRAAYFIDKILKGAKPGDIPIEQAAKFDCVVNLKTAKAIGVKIPGSIMIRATKVIE